MDCSRNKSCLTLSLDRYHLEMPRKWLEEFSVCLEGAQLEKFKVKEKRLLFYNISPLYLLISKLSIVSALFRLNKSNNY